MFYVLPDPVLFSADPAPICINGYVSYLFLFHAYLILIYTYKKIFRIKVGCGFFFQLSRIRGKIWSLTTAVLETISKIRKTNNKRCAAGEDEPDEDGDGRHEAGARGSKALLPYLQYLIQTFRLFIHIARG